MTLARNLPVLFGANHKDPNLRFRLGDVLVNRRSAVLRAVDSQPEKLELFRHALAQWSAILADSTGEYDRVDSAQRRHHRANPKAQAMRINVERETRAFASMRHRIQNFSHVAADARQATQPGFPIQNAVELVGGVALVAHQIDQDTRIDGPGTRAHHESFKRREAHGGFDALAIAHGRE